MGIQLAHAGRKGATFAPWRGHGSVPVTDGGWEAEAPSAAPFGRYAMPREMTRDDLARVRRAFAAAAARADGLGMETVEIHAAHGYLLHEFMSPLSNLRTDEYGGDLEGRMRFPLEVVAAVRESWPERKPLLVRVSASDWVPGGWDVDSTVEFARRAASLGADLVDVSSGGLDPRQQIPLGPGYQVPFAERIRAEAAVPTGTVGLITEAAQAESILTAGSADVVLLARALLRNPRWALDAAHELGADVRWPNQYLRARLS
jgi:2,4-dienoyl-CoA reductase-like NADH-dependent reductase (Old Yellow Enzyme family)